MDYAERYRMAETKRFMIELAHGPFEVTKKTGLEIAAKVKFRHFKPVELAIAREFITKAILEGVYYFDVYLLTEKAKKIISETPELNWKIAVPWMYRIDAVCYTFDAVWIIEFKERVSMYAIGELLGYKGMFIKQYEPKKEVRLMLVAKYDEPEVHPVLREHNIRLVVL